MATKIKGIYKSFKFISQIFVVKEREMDIGYPTDVKHVAHIGWDGPPGSGPSWMNEFTAAPNFSTSLGNMGARRDANPMPNTSWSTQDFDESKRSESTSSNNISSSEIPQTSKKNKRRKTKLTSSPMSSSSSATRHSRAPKSKATFSETGVRPTVQV